MHDERREALARVLFGRIARCSFDELRALDRVATRLELGRERYGLLDLRRSDWKQERADELLDALLYTAFDELVEQDRRNEPCGSQPQPSEGAESHDSAASGGGCIGTFLGVPVYPDETADRVWFNGPPRRADDGWSAAIRRSLGRGRK